MSPRPTFSVSPGAILTFRVVWTGLALFVCSVTEVSAQTPIAVLECGAPLSNAAFSVDDSAIFTVTERGQVKAWSTRDWKTRTALQAHKGNTKIIEILDKGGRKLITTGSDGLTKLWDEGHVISEKQIKPEVWGSSLSKDRTLLAVANASDTVQILRTGLGRLPTGKNLQQKAQFGEAWKSIRGHRAECCRFSNDGRLLATGGTDNNTQLWEVETGKNLGTLESKKDDSFSGHAVYAIAFSRGDSVLAFTSSDGFCSVWRVREKRRFRSFHKMGSGGVSSLVFSKDEKKLITASADGFLRVWSIPDDTLLKEIRAHDKLIWHIVASHDNAWLASSSDDETVKIWRLSDLLR